MNKAMKYSGVEWLGKIPRDWEVLKAKRIFKLKNEKNSELKPLLSVSKGRGLLLREDMENRPTHAQKNIETFKLVDEGDFVIHLRSFQSGFELSSIEGAVSPAYTVFNARKNDEVCDKYYKYLFYSKPFIDKIASTTLSLRDGKPISYDEFSITLLPVPNYVEQQKIAAFLDEKVSRIENIIEDTKKSIENLKAYKQSLITETVTKGLNPNVEMKNSGIEYIGNIPSHWRCGKFKYLLKTPLKYGANESGLSYNQNKPRYIRITDILEGNKLTNANKQSLDEDVAKEYMLEIGDLLFARSGATAGKTYMVTEDTPRSAFAGYLIKGNVEDLSTSNYIYYYTLSKSYEEWKNSIVIQATIQNIGAEKYANMFLPLPPKGELIEIIEFLNEKTESIDSILESKNSLLVELETYKKSLIYEYVTGKKEVK